MAGIIFNKCNTIFECVNSSLLNFFFYLQLSNLLMRVYA